MGYYEITDGLYRIEGGFGRAGENFGGVLIDDDLPIVIGATGDSFVKSLTSIIADKGLSSNIQIFLPAITIHELTILDKINQKFPDAIIHVHKDIVDVVKNPRSNYMIDRFTTIDSRTVKNLSHELPKTLTNIKAVSKNFKYEGTKTKILIIPFAGPHKGHMIVYSTGQKLLASGILTKFSPSDQATYYIDYTGSIQAYYNGIEFINQATSKIHFPAYDEPYFTTSQINSDYVKNSMKNTESNLYEIIKERAVSRENLFQKFFAIHEKPELGAYLDFKLHETILQIHLDNMVKSGMISKKDDDYKVV